MEENRGLSGKGSLDQQRVHENKTTLRWLDGTKDQRYNR